MLMLVEEEEGGDEEEEEELEASLCVAIGVIWSKLAELELVLSASEGDGQSLKQAES